MKKVQQILETLTKNISNENMQNMDDDNLNLCVRCEKYLAVKNNLCDFCLEKLNNLIPKRFQKCSFDNFIVNEKNKDAFEKANHFLDLDNPKGLYIYGTVGSGKTHLAIAVFKKLFFMKKDVRFITMSELLLEIKSCFSKNWNEEEVISEYADCEYLILDDFGTQKQSEFNIEMIYLLFDRRYRNGLDKMFITSNLSIKDLAVTYGDRIASRIMSMCEISKIDDIDRRIEK